MIKMTNDEEPHFVFDKMSGMAKRVLILIIIVCALGAITSDSMGITIIGGSIGWFITGPSCWGWAYNKDRNEDFAFIWGFAFGIPGAIIYWVYTLFYKKNPNNWDEGTEVKK